MKTLEALHDKRRNDGEVCTFSAHTDYSLSVNGDNDAESKSYKLTYDKKKNTDYNEFIGEVYPKIKEFLQQFKNSDFLTMFGDHCQVTVYRNKIEVEAHEHA